MRLEAELILLVDTSHGHVAELAGSSDDPAAVARRGAGNVDIGSGDLQLDIRDEELALGSLLLDDGGDGGWQRASHGEVR